MMAIVCRNWQRGDGNQQVLLRLEQPLWCLLPSLRSLLPSFNVTVLAVYIARQLCDTASLYFFKASLYTLHVCAIIYYTAFKTVHQAQKTSYRK